MSKIILKVCPFVKGTGQVRVIATNGPAPLRLILISIRLEDIFLVGIVIVTANGGTDIAHGDGPQAFHTRAVLPRVPSSTEDLLDPLVPSGTIVVVAGDLV